MLTRKYKYAHVIYRIIEIYGIDKGHSVGSNE